MTLTRTGRRAASAAIAAALIATLTLTGAVAAKDNPTKPEKAHPVKAGQTQGGGGGGGGGGAKPAVAEKPVSLRVKGNASHPGSVLRVNAVLKSARDVRPETMEAVVHFATGDVTVELTRRGGGASYHAWVLVPDGEPEGVVPIDATAEVDGEVVEATGTGKVLVRGSGASDDPQQLEEPEVSPESCEPEADPGPNPSGSPEPSASADPEPSPSGSADPDPSPSDDGGGASPDPSVPPDADETADEACDAADDEVQLTLMVLARIVAYIESLMA